MWGEPEYLIVTCFCTGAIYILITFGNKMLFYKELLKIVLRLSWQSYKSRSSGL
jgi:hypothetical protein